MNDWIDKETGRALARLIPRLETALGIRLDVDARPWSVFRGRLEREWPRLFRLLVNLYGGHYDFFYHLESILTVTARAWHERPEALKALDADREAEPEWFLSEEMIGGVLYVDLFSDNLARLQEHISYFRELELTYLHLMPIFAVPTEQNDGGYAVSSYRAVNPELGTMEQLTQLADRLREAGISLVLDFVFNHTSDEHEWALRAQSGDPEYQAYYHLFPDRRMPDQYERTLREIFPTVRRGNFTWHEGMQKWVWTTFNSYQWDLNYSNPAVFAAMAEEMLYLANTGVEVLRLDAVAFIWKEMGTTCENLPQAHTIIQAFNALARIAAPSLLFKSEAIVHPDEVVRYIGREECPLSYNPMLMALLWEATATRNVNLLAHAMRKRARIPNGCSWVNYLRCHDDIGWTFDDVDAWETGIHPGNHRHFLNEFYSGGFPGSFARGVPFQFNPDNGDMRISGTLASLAGLEQALELEDPLLIEMAVRRIMMLRSMVMSVSGIPLIYLGDEWGMLNDYTYLHDPAKAGDSRWVHRSRRRWNRRDFEDTDTIEWRLFDGLRQLAHARKRLPAMRNGGMEILDSGNPKLFTFLRSHEDQTLLVVTNLSDSEATMSPDRYGPNAKRSEWYDHIAAEKVDPLLSLVMGPYQYRWIERRPSGKPAGE
ncbi:MAG: alpha-amylase family glycosyl hydrolase [Desulfobacterales bacterium]